LIHTLAVRLDAETIDTLADLGRAKGIGPSTLARIWLLERLGEEKEGAQEKRRSKARGVRAPATREQQ
jgi:hypothetical protein